MSSVKPRALLDIEYDNAAQAYLRSLPPEHFMEATSQATQREIFLASLGLVQDDRPEVRYFNELLVQYRLVRSGPIRQVVPDNMVVVHPQPIKATTNFGLELQPARPFWMLEYVSKHSQRKDYETSFQKYEKELKVPFYLVFYPDNQELTLYLLRRGKYRAVPPNDQDRYAIPYLHLELGLLEGWVRFWYKGRLLALPGQFQRELAQTRQLLEEERRRAEQAQHRAERAEEELTRLRAQFGLPPS